MKNILKSAKYTGNFVEYAKLLKAKNMSIIIFRKVIALLVAATLCVGLAQRGQRRGQEGRGENAQAGQAAQQGTQEGEDFQEEGQEGPRGQQGNSDHVR